MNNTGSFTEHNIQIIGREKILITGIKSVDSFDEAIIVATTVNDARLCIEGSDLMVKDVNLDKGQLEAVGLFCGMYYDTDFVSKKSFFSLFKRQ